MKFSFHKNKFLTGFGINIFRNIEFKHFKYIEIIIYFGQRYLVIELFRKY